MSAARRTQPTVAAQAPHQAFRHLYSTPALADRHHPLASSSSSPMPPTPAGVDSLSSTAQYMHAQAAAASLAAKAGGASLLARKPVPVPSKTSLSASTLAPPLIPVDPAASVEVLRRKKRRVPNAALAANGSMNEQVQEALRKAGLSSEQFNAMKDRIVAAFGADKSFIRAQREIDRAEARERAAQEAALEAEVAQKRASSGREGSAPLAARQVKTAADEAGSLRRVASNPTVAAAAGARSNSQPPFRLAPGQGATAHERSFSNASLRSTASSSASASLSDLSPDLHGPDSITGSATSQSRHFKLDDIAEGNAAGRRERRDRRRTASNRASIAGSASVGQRTPRDARELPTNWAADGAAHVGLGLAYEAEEQAPVDEEEADEEEEATPVKLEHRQATPEPPLVQPSWGAQPAAAFRSGWTPKGVASAAMEWIFEDKEVVQQQQAMHFPGIFAGHPRAYQARPQAYDQPAMWDTEKRRAPEDDMQGRPAKRPAVDLVLPSDPVPRHLHGPATATATGTSSPCPSFVSLHIPPSRTHSVSPAPGGLESWPPGAVYRQMAEPSRASSETSSLAPPPPIPAARPERFYGGMMGSAPMPPPSAPYASSPAMPPARFSPAPPPPSAQAATARGFGSAGKKPPVQMARTASTTSSAPGSGGKPNFSYAAMIGQAILSAPLKKICLNDIYSYIMATYPYYKKEDAGWQNSIRHNLSLNESFIKVPRGPDEPGKGHFWAIAEGAEDQFANGGFKKRPSGNGGPPSSASVSSAQQTVSGSTAGAGGAGGAKRRVGKATGRGKGKAKAAAGSQDDGPDSSSVGDASSSPAKFIETSPVKRPVQAYAPQPQLRSEGSAPEDLPGARRLAPPANLVRHASTTSLASEDASSPDPSPLLATRQLPPTIPSAASEQARLALRLPAPINFGSPPSKVLAKIKGPYEPISRNALAYYDEEQEQRHAVLLSSPAFEDCGIVHHHQRGEKLGAPMEERRAGSRRSASAAPDSSDDERDAGEDHHRPRIGNGQAGIFAAPGEHHRAFARLPHLPGLASMSPIAGLRGGLGASFTSPLQPRVRTFSATSNIRGGENDAVEDESLTLPPLQNLEPKTPEGKSSEEGEPSKPASPRKEVKLASLGPLKEVLGREIFSTPVQGGSGGGGGGSGPGGVVGRLFFGTPAGRYANASPGFGYDEAAWLAGPADPYDTGVQVSAELERLARKGKDKESATSSTTKTSSAVGKEGGDATAAAVAAGQRARLLQTPGLDLSTPKFSYSPW